MDWFGEVGARLLPGASVTWTAYQLAALAAVSAIVMAFDPLWRVARLGVTLVHELGHALVGVLSGRRFTGFVVRGDASGHTVTVGRPRGPGLVVTTWAGYPAPGVVGAALVLAAVRGWAAPVLAAALVVLALVLVRVRSVLTLVVVLGLAAVVFANWWWRDDARQGATLIVVGVVLLVGAWRHLYAVVRLGGSGDDPAALARLTRVPATLWLLSFAAALSGSTWAVWRWAVS